MNSKNKNILIVSLLVLIAISVWGYYFLNKQNELPPTNQPQNTANTNEPVGTISTTTGGLTSYVNKSLGLTFEFPQDWHLGVNTLGDASGHGYLQLFNYDEKTADGKSVFSEGHNKIESTISLSNKYIQSSDYPANSVNERQVKIGDQDVTQTDIELLGGQKMRIHLIQIPTDTQKFLSITIYGDADNFFVAGNLIKSIQWAQK